MTRAALLTLLLARPALAGVVPVATSAQLVAAIDGAAAGDVITLAPGIYALTENLLCDTPGTPAAPIVVRAASPDTAEVRFDAIEGFKVSAPHWIFEDLVVRGVPALGDDCMHAFHALGRRRIVCTHFIHDHQKAGGDQVSHAVFLKGNSRDELFERNLVICERDHAGGGFGTARGRRTVRAAAARGSRAHNSW